MMKFWTSKYELFPWHAIGSVADNKPREGALLKVQWPNGAIGYADIFPWPEFGDASLDEQIKALARGKLSNVVEQSIWLAKKDAVWRRDGKNIHSGAAKVKNHYLISDFMKFTDENMKEAKSAGFTTFKIKVGRAVDEEGKFVARFIKQNSMMVRLDFNAKSDFSEFERLMSHLGPAEKARVEYVEDPVPWDIEAWQEISELVPIAIDNESEHLDLEKFSEKPPFQIMILKPSRQDMEKAINFVNKFGLKMVVSSSLDHPVGIAHACAQASELKKFYPNRVLDCGCLSMRTYKPNEFSTQIQTTGPFLKDIRGSGIGFDDLFNRIEWTPVEK